MQAKKLQAPPIPKPWEKNKPRLTDAQRRLLVERRIAEAMEQGKFDNLPGAGKPIKIEMPTTLALLDEESTIQRVLRGRA